MFFLEINNLFNFFIFSDMNTETFMDICGNLAVLTSNHTQVVSSTLELSLLEALYGSINVSGDVVTDLLSLDVFDAGCELSKVSIWQESSTLQFLGS